MILLLVSNGKWEQCGMPQSVTICNHIGLMMATVIRVSLYIQKCAVYSKCMFLLWLQGLMLLLYTTKWPTARFLFSSSFCPLSTITGRLSLCHCVCVRWLCCTCWWEWLCSVGWHVCDCGVTHPSRDARTLADKRMGIKIGWGLATQTRQSCLLCFQARTMAYSVISSLYILRHV